MVGGSTRVCYVGLLIVVATLVVVGITGEPSSWLDADALRQTGRDHIWHAAGLFLAASVGINLLFMPASPIAVLAGVVFGGAFGGSLACVSLLTSSLVAFSLARGLGRPRVGEFVADGAGKLRGLETFLHDHGLITVVVLRVTPTLPLSAVNALLGRSPVRTRDFVLGTVIGILPGTYLLAYLGSAALEPQDPRFWLLVALNVLVIAAAVLGATRLRRRLQP